MVYNDIIYLLHCADNWFYIKKGSRHMSFLSKKAAGYICLACFIAVILTAADIS